MPSPLAHASAGYLVSRLLWRRVRSGSSLVARGAILLTVIFLALLPDLDAIPGILAGDLKHYHNNRTHSVLVGLAVSLGMGVAMKALRMKRALLWSLTALACYELHVAMDYVTRGSRGIMAYWPLSAQRFGPPSASVFTGLHWHKGVFSADHVWTILNEAAFTLIVAGVVFLMERHGRDAEHRG
jgi:hypothetical protein